MHKLSFKEYCESKEILLESSTTKVMFNTTHIVNKYCKIPLYLIDAKVYVSFKPRELILIEWQRVGSTIELSSICVHDQTYNSVWVAEKIKSWVQQTTTQLFDHS